MQNIKNIDELIAIWKNDGNKPGLKEEGYLSLGKNALEFGHPSLAYDILKKGMQSWPEDVEVCYFAALALARSGSFSTAYELLQTLFKTIDKQHRVYPDLLSLAGRLAKDCWSKILDVERKKYFAQQSMDYYKTAFDLTRDYYPGVNAATMAYIAGQKNEAGSIALEVKQICNDLISNNETNDHWLSAALGECHLLLGTFAEAEDAYLQAIKLAGDRYGDIASIRRQIVYLSGHIDGCEAILENIPLPQVIAFTGHMIDADDRVDKRFPLEIEQSVSNAIQKALSAYDAIIAYSSAACGADLLFLEAVQKSAGETHIILPFKQSDFIEISVAFAGEDWISRFNTVVDNATSVLFATNEGYLGDDVLFSYANYLIHGKALLKSDELANRAILLAVIDKTTKADTGGTLDSINNWQALDNPVELIDLAQLRTQFDKGREISPKKIDGSETKASIRNISRQIKTMLFADCVGFSRLGEESAPSFFVNFLGEIANVINNVEHPPLFSNTWGDGLFLVFDEIHHAAEFALKLKDVVLETDWKKYGLPEETNIRIGMHSGPVFSTEDPIIKRENFFGTHVNLAARIEPITTPGSVFLTEQSACLLAASGNKQYTCDYLGLTELAKKYGSDSLYRLRRSEALE